MGCGGFPGPGKGWGHPDKSARPLPPLPLTVHSPASRRAGAGESPFPPPPPTLAVQHHSGRQGRVTRAHIPAGLPISHTYTHTHTHTPANKGSGHPGPLLPPRSERAGHPLPRPLQGKLWTTTAAGRGTWRPGGRGSGREGGASIAPQESQGPPRSRLRASGWPPG